MSNRLKSASHSSSETKTWILIMKEINDVEIFVEIHETFYNCIFRMLKCLIVQWKTEKGGEVIKYLQWPIKINNFSSLGTS